MLHKCIDGLAKGMALLGGAVLCLLIVMVCTSIIGRELNSLASQGHLGGSGAWLLGLGIGPVNGDFELIEAGIAFAIFAFLPLTQLNGAHAKVDVFTSGLSPKSNARIAGFWSGLMAAVIILITWRLFVGMQDKLRYGETTFLIQFPIWWAYAASFVAALSASIVSLYCAVMQFAGRRLI